MTQLPAKPPAKRVRPITGVLIFLSVSCAALAVFELGCRLYGVDCNPNPYWRFHPTLGWTQTPSWTSVNEVDGQPVRFEFKDLGFRDVEHA